VGAAAPEQRIVGRDRPRNSRVPSVRFSAANALHAFIRSPDCASFGRPTHLLDLRQLSSCSPAEMSNGKSRAANVPIRLEIRRLAHRDTRHGRCGDRCPFVCNVGRSGGASKFGQHIPSVALGMPFDAPSDKRYLKPNGSAGTGLILNQYLSLVRFDNGSCDG
jgi:hypothetical protein